MDKSTAGLAVEWAQRVKPIRIRRLYRSARLGVYDDEALQDVGSALYARCCDMAAVADAYRYGQVPCPQCSAKVQRKVDPLFGLEGHGRRDGWFDCPHCAKRLLWIDCRKALRKKRRCFDCHSLLKGTDALRCRCDKEWDRKAYHRSVGARLRLPCPHCKTVIRKPTRPASDKETGYRPSGREVECPKCEGVALHISGYIQCDGWIMFEHEKRWHPELEDPEEIFPVFAAWARPLIG